MIDHLITIKISGPRASGKTTLLRAIYKHLLRESLTDDSIIVVKDDGMRVDPSHFDDAKREMPPIALLIETEETK